MIDTAICARCEKPFRHFEEQAPLVCGECLDWLGSQPGSGVELKGYEVD